MQIAAQAGTRREPLIIVRRQGDLQKETNVIAALSVLAFYARLVPSQPLPRAECHRHLITTTSLSYMATMVGLKAEEESALSAFTQQCTEQGLLKARGGQNVEDIPDGITDESTLL